MVLRAMRKTETRSEWLTLQNVIFSNPHFRQMFIFLCYQGGKGSSERVFDLARFQQLLQDKTEGLNMSQYLSQYARLPYAKIVKSAQPLIAWRVPSPWSFPCAVCFTHMTPLQFLKEPQHFLSPGLCTVWPRVSPSVRCCPQMSLGDEPIRHTDTWLSNIASWREKVILFSSHFLYF